MRNKCKTVTLGFVLICLVVVCGWWVPDVWTAEVKKNVDPMKALGDRVSALETQVARLRRLVDGIIDGSINLKDVNDFSPRGPAGVGTEPKPDTETLQIRNEAFRAMKDAERRYQLAVKRRGTVEKERASQKFVPERKRISLSEEYSAAQKSEETARKEMLEAQKRYQEILQPKPSK
jgi:hypothetical protein